MKAERGQIAIYFTLPKPYFASMIAEAIATPPRPMRRPTPRRTVRLLSHTVQPTSGESRVLLNGKTWQDYLALDAERDRRGGFRVTYLEGVIELMFPSFEHEIRKSNISRVLESYLARKDIDYTCHGSTTLRSEIKDAGKEPDESYAFGDVRKLRPDLAIEIAITSGGIDTLEIYRRWAIPEVWIWQKGELRVFVFNGEAYANSSTSRWFPELDLHLLAECARIENTAKARKAFLAGLDAASANQ